MIYSQIVDLAGDLQALQEECRALQRRYISDQSVKTRASQLNKYYEFCEKYALDLIPCPSHQISWFVAYMARTLRPVSIRNYVCALNDFLKGEGATPVDYCDVGISRALAGASRVLGEEVRRAAPILPNQMVTMFSYLSEAPVHTCLRAAILTAFRALLRSQNVTLSDAVLRRRNFKFHDWGMLVEIERSKTIQKREKVLRLPVAYSPDRRLCAAWWTAQHFKEVPAPLDSPAFIIPDDPPTPLDYNTYLGAIKYLAEMAGLDPTDFSTHSMRRGGTTFIWLAGASKEEIKTRGDWSSEVYHQYLDTPLESRISRDIQVANTMALLVSAQH